MMKVTVDTIILRTFQCKFIEDEITRNDRSYSRL